MKTTTYQQALANGEISLEIPVYESQHLFVSQKGIIKLSDSNHLTEGGGEQDENDNLQNFTDEYFIFRDIFGKLSRFFRAYTHHTLECKVRILPYAYAYTHQEIVFTRSKKALIDHTPFRRHPFSPPLSNTSNIKNYIYLIKRTLSYIYLIKQWFSFYTKSLFAKRYNTSVALLTREVANNYYHFLNETLAEYYQLKLAKKEPDFYILPLEMPFHKQVYQLLNIDIKRIIPSHTRKLIRAKELIIPTLLADYEILEYRKYTHFDSHILPLFTYTMHKELFHKTLSITHTLKPTRKIFLARPAHSNRNFTNHQEIEKVMREYGFEIIMPDSLSVEEQIHTIREAAYVVSPHGAALENLVFAKEQTKVLEIFPQYYHNRCPQFVALAQKCQYSYLIGDTQDTSMHPQQECIYLSADKLRFALDIFLGS
ncbi:glycosyltransferase family 61 protein [Helicobacter typhlonius]|uniref:Capsular polysaccharide biosynthesis protein-like protein n=2 Tax=Helicobacter typhlonius TaxID=76936 RepID=A0A0S4PY98_9HELI|nr:glycosyltransferase family 61 protein [Helicobacter typhlonius]TLD78582.1 glycosyltransferase family 61 protein [Helicobacter typhlonius]CUU40174.1 Capsular polysaccharide biosynthesis protein-like protein [Helicobacter typhlonius]